MRSSVKQTDKPDNELLSHTIAVWQRRTDRKLSREDARDIVRNMTGFFDLLAEWAEAEARGPEPDDTDR